MKQELLSLVYRNTAPAAGNRLTETLLNAAIYQKAIYLKWLEISQARVTDNLFNERNVTGVFIAVVSNVSGWNTRPFTGTLGANTLYGGSGYGIELHPGNCPAKIDLGNIYIPSGESFTINMQIYCAGIVATDTVDILCRVGFQYEATEEYYVKDFDLPNYSF